MNTLLVKTNKLRAAVEAEKGDVEERMRRYKLLTAKIADYQTGLGDAPTEDEFTQWLQDVKHAVELKKMMGAT